MGNLPVVAAEPHRIEHALTYLRSEWTKVPQYVQDWPTWDEDAKLDFVLEWPMREDQLAMLRSWSAHGDLNADEADCLTEIEHLVAKNRPLLQPLLDED